MASISINTVIGVQAEQGKWALKETPAFAQIISKLSGITHSSASYLHHGAGATSRLVRSGGFSGRGTWGIVDCNRMA
jgi:hypothetical protein